VAKTPVALRLEFTDGRGRAAGAIWLSTRNEGVWLLEVLPSMPADERVAEPLGKGTVMKLPNIEIGFQVFVSDGGQEVGAVRLVAPFGRPELEIYVENAGDFVVPLTAVASVHANKVVLDCKKLDLNKVRTNKVRTL
jgi:hypothetical protein